MVDPDAVSTMRCTPSWDAATLAASSATLTLLLGAGVPKCSSAGCNDSSAPVSAMKATSTAAIRPGNEWILRSMILA